jgi:hypothetical protein
VTSALRKFRAVLPDFYPCLLSERDDLVVDQTRFAEPGRHQDHRALAGFRQVEQRIGIADLDIIGAEAFFVQLLRGNRDNLVKIALAGRQLLRRALITLYSPGAILRWSALR